MKYLRVIAIATVAGLMLNSCATPSHISKPQRCLEIDRQISAYQHPSSGYSWNVAQLKISQLRHEAHTIGCQ